MPPGRPRADELYRTAEAALARRDLLAADRALAQLLSDHPHSPLGDQALYERARIAYQRRAWGDARRHLDLLAAIAQSPLAEPGHYLTCRIAVEARDRDAARCLADYRARYPKSPHDRDALAKIVGLAHGDGGCREARPFIDELARSYPDATSARVWRTRCPEIKP